MSMNAYRKGIVINHTQSLDRPTLAIH
jgi:hypothetical protein